MRLLSVQSYKLRLKNDYSINLNILKFHYKNSSMCNISGAKWVCYGVSNWLYLGLEKECVHKHWL